LDDKEVVTTIQKAVGESDLVVVNIHWGDEYKTISNARQRALAHRMIDAGADIIIGHHPHVVEEMEIYHNRPIFYSLGNFVFDQYFSKETQEGLAVGVVASTSSISLTIFPLQSVQSQIQQLDFESSFKYMNAWFAKSRLSEYNFNNLNNLIINL
jgi:poly-gamma-glutamate synthesis protein (capsule biosynthesis protein)